MHRFFVPSTWIQGPEARLQGDVAHQIGRVLRMSPGDVVTLLDNSGMEYTVRLTRLGTDLVEGTILSAEEGPGEPAVRVTLYQGILKGQKFDWVLQKGTELGVDIFVPIICQRSIPQKRDGWGRTRYPRWQKVVTEAAEQSGRCRLPTVREPVGFEEACREVGDPALTLIPCEQENATGLREALQGTRPPEVNIFIGPEGGFEEGEVSCARACGAVSVSLGRRILRAETAGIVAVAAVMYEAGELGNVNEELQGYSPWHRNNNIDPLGRVSRVRPRDISVLELDRPELAGHRNGVNRLGLGSVRLLSWRTQSQQTQIQGQQTQIQQQQMELLYHPTLFAYQPMPKPRVETDLSVVVLEVRKYLAWEVGLINYSAVPIVIEGFCLRATEVPSTDGNAGQQPWSMNIGRPDCTYYELDDKYPAGERQLPQNAVIMPGQRLLIGLHINQKPENEWHTKIKMCSAKLHIHVGYHTVGGSRSLDEESEEFGTGNLTRKSQNVLGG